MIIGRPIAKIVDIITGILAFLVICLLMVLYINGTFHFIKGDTLVKLVKLRDIGILAVIGLCGLEFALKRNIFFFVGFVIIIAITLFFMIYSGFSFGI